MSASAWIQAARLPSQVNVAPSLLLGQVLAWRATGSLDPVALIAVFGFGLLDQLTIVFANDYADRETDAANRTATPFSGGSRVLVEGRLRPAQLRAAAWWAAIGTLGVSAWLGPTLLALAAIALLLLWLYSFGPARLSYRGGGELLQMAGVAVVLPLYGWVAQGAALDAFPWALLGVLLPLQWANAVATALPDQPSDLASGKRTAVVWWGQRNAGAAMLLAQGFAFVFLVLQVGATAGALILVVPVLAACGQLALVTAEPGSRAMLTRAVCGMLATFATMLGLVVWAWPG